jgi:hypothetical protein
MDHLTPFDHDGKLACQAIVFSTDGGKTKFAGYLLRINPGAKARIDSQMQDFKSGRTRSPPNVGVADVEVKRPGAENPWVSRANYAEAGKIMKPECPANATLEMQIP